MKPAQLHALADAAHGLFLGAEEAERNPERLREDELRQALRPLLAAVLGHYTLKEITALALESALELHGTTRAAAAALGVTRAMFYSDRPYRRGKARSAA